jgi:hypothetical protein
VRAFGGAIIGASPAVLEIAGIHSKRLSFHTTKLGLFRWIASIFCDWVLANLSYLDSLFKPISKQTN